MAPKQGYRLHKYVTRVLPKYEYTKAYSSNGGVVRFWKPMSGAAYAQAPLPFHLGNAEWWPSLNEIVGFATHTVQVVKQVLHHGIANDRSQRGQTRRIPMGMYRCQLARVLCDEVLYRTGGNAWFDAVGAGAAGAQQAKAGNCDEHARLSFAHMLLHAEGARIIIARFTDKRDHVFTLLQTGTYMVVVDAWPRQPVICFPDENYWDYLQAQELWIADVLSSGFDITKEYCRLAAHLRDSVKASLKPKLEGRLGGNYAHPSNWDWKRFGNKYLGRPVIYSGGGVPQGICVPLPQRPAPGQGVVYY